MALFKKKDNRRKVDIIVENLLSNDYGEIKIDINREVLVAPLPKLEEVYDGCQIDHSLIYFINNSSKVYIVAYPDLRLYLINNLGEQRELPIDFLEDLSDLLPIRLSIFDNDDNSDWKTEKLLKKQKAILGAFFGITPKQSMVSLLRNTNIENFTHLLINKKDDVILVLPERMDNPRIDGINITYSIDKVTVHNAKFNVLLHENQKPEFSISMTDATTISDNQLLPEQKQYDYLKLISISDGSYKFYMRMKYQQYASKVYYSIDSLTNDLNILPSRFTIDKNSVAQRILKVVFDLYFNDERE